MEWGAVGPGHPRRVVTRAPLPQAVAESLGPLSHGLHWALHEPET